MSSVSSEMTARAAARGRVNGMLAVLALLGFVGNLRAEDDTEFFEKKVRPILAGHCYRCHNAAKKQGGGLVLDSRAGRQKGGETGPAVRPGDPEGSLLVKAVRWKDEALQMPPEDAGGKLSDSQIADLESWVKRGAFDPRTETEVVLKRSSWAETFEERRDWWSLKPVRRAAVPAVDDVEWSGTIVDRFLRQRMTEKRVVPAATATPRTLIRRATLVLTGLPPSAEESAAFEAAARRDPAKAYAALIDRLLASPRYGERFARHWLDVVRFSETHGNEWNYDVPYAWRYRDYLIRAFNDDVPYDQFVREHIAGDLLPQFRWNAREKLNESVIGTAFYRFGEVNHDSCVEFGVIGYDIVDNQLDTLTKTFQAATVACARCHDHKKDAISSRDYHALLGILRSTRSVQHTLDAPEVNHDATAELNHIKTKIRAELAAIWRNEAKAIDAARLSARHEDPKKALPTIDSPSRPWVALSRANASKENLNTAWKSLVGEHVKESASRAEINRKQFTPIADFRNRFEPGWTRTGMGLRDDIGKSGDLVVALDGDAAVKGVLPSGLFTFAVSDTFNGASRSPELTRKGGKISFEVLGGGGSLTRVVFNNCQLNYTNQHSIHHDKWTWVTVTFPENTGELHPYAELLTFWDSPKFPDPLGTLGKDKENQREPWNVHAKIPRTWWGVRRVVAHDGAETPKEELSHLGRLYANEPPAGLDSLASRYATIAAEAVNAFADNRATDDDVKWLEWLRESGLIANKANATARLAALVTSYRDVEKSLSLPRMMPGMADEGAAFSQPLLARGEYTRPGEPVERRYLQMIDADRSAGTLPGSGRAYVAEQIASPLNPLTARVMVNRVWHWLFGNGLVGTPDDFGHLGEKPTHPELLDHLAARFVDEGWSLKRLVREIVQSRAFRTAAAPVAGTREIDPDNILLSHYPARRAEAEVIRDGLLAVSGRLDGTLYGPSVHPYREKADTEKRLYVGPLDGDGRRSLYIKFQLMESPHFLNAFNLPGGKVTQGRRDTSNVPAQSLALMNDPFVQAMAERWAILLVADGSANIDSRVETMFRAAFGRPATASGRERFSAAVGTFAAMHHVPADKVMGSRAVWKDAAHAVFNFKEFIFIP